MPKILIDIPEEDYNRINASTNKTSSDFVVMNSAQLDGLTNGEVLMKMLPYAEVEVEEYWVFVNLPCESYEFFRLNFPIDWWNAKWGE